MLAPPVILLAEDDPNDVFLMRRAFQRLNCEERLVHCNNGEEVMSALASFSERQPLPTLCLLDIKMPRKNGFETLHWIRSQPAFCPMPVVMMSSSSQESDIQLARVLGATDYIVKPTTLNGLYRIVQTLADRWRLCEGFQP